MLLNGWITLFLCGEKIMVLPNGLSLCFFYSDFVSLVGKLRSKFVKKVLHTNRELLWDGAINYIFYRVAKCSS